MNIDKNILSMLFVGNNDIIQWIKSTFERADTI